MTWLDPLLHALLARAETLVVLLVAGCFVGELVAQLTGVAWVLRHFDALAAKLERKLNRPDRSIATRVYRGMIALAMLLVPALALGVLLSRDVMWAHWASLLVVVALFGHGFSLVRQWQYWRRADAGGMPLELPKLGFLFADSHAVIRYLILAGGERFAVYVVGAGFWYALGGMVPMLAYVVVAQVAQHHRGAVFGWAAGALFRLLDMVPRVLTLVLLTLAGMFVPGAKPWRVRKAKQFYGFLAYLTDCALGGTLPGRELPWAGEGTPKARPEHLARWLLLEVAAGVLLLFLLSAEQIINTLNQLH